MRPLFSRSISAKPSKNSKDYDVQKEMSPMSTSTHNEKVMDKYNSKSSKIKYRKSSSSRCTVSSSSRASSMHNINVDLTHKLNHIAKQKYYLLPHDDPRCFIVYGDSSSKYKVNIGPQICSCISTLSSSQNTPSFPCVHLLFVMCKVLQVSENDQMLLSDRLKTTEVDNLLNRFNQRNKEKVTKKSCRFIPRIRSELKPEPKHESKSRNNSSNKGGFFTSRSEKEVHRQNHNYNNQAGINEIDKVELDEIICSICLSEMNVNTQQLVFCDSCSNEFHKKCISIWMKECKKAEEAITCPLCRIVWSQNVTSSPNIEENTHQYLPRSQSTYTQPNSCKYQNNQLEGCAPMDMSVPNVNLMSSRSHSAMVTGNITVGTSNNGSNSNVCHATTTMGHSMSFGGSSHISSRSTGTGSSSNDSSGIGNSSRCLGYCISDEVVQLLSSDQSDHRENGLRLVAEKTLQILMSASVSHTHRNGHHGNNSSEQGGDQVGNMGGHTTGVILKESFRVIAKLLDDSCYSLFVAAIRAFREILGFLVCKYESDVERVSKMISPVLCQLIRICGGPSTNSSGVVGSSSESNHSKKKSQMSLSALFELAKGQDGGIALGRELKATSLPVTGYVRLTKFVLTESSSRFKCSHCYGRLALLDKLLDKFDFNLDLMRRIVNWVGRQLILMHRSTQLIGGSSAALVISDNGGSNVVSPSILETTDVDTGLSSWDIQILSNEKLHNLAKKLYINVARMTMERLKFDGHSSDEMYEEITKEVNKMPDNLRDKFMEKLKLNSHYNTTAANTATVNNNTSLFRPPEPSNSPNSISVLSMLHQTKSNTNPSHQHIGGSTVAFKVNPIVLQQQVTSSNNIGDYNMGNNVSGRSNSMAAGGMSKSYRISKRFSAANRNNSNNTTNSVSFIKSRTRSLSNVGGGHANTILLNAGTTCMCNSQQCTCGYTNTTNNNILTNNGSGRHMSPFIRITPEPAYDAVPLSDDNGLEGNFIEEDDEDHDKFSEDDEGNDIESSRIRQREIKQTQQFLSELAIHNSMYGVSNNCISSSNTNANTNSSKKEEHNTMCNNKSLEMITAIVKEDNRKTVTKEMEIESIAPPGLSVFSGAYKPGRDWVQGHLLGTGAFSKCYQARDSRTGLLMAVKQIPLGPGSRPSYSAFSNVAQGGANSGNNGTSNTNTTSSSLNFAVTGCVGGDRREAVLRAVRTEAQLMTRLRHPNVLPLLGTVLHCVGRRRRLMTSDNYDTRDHGDRNDDEDGAGSGGGGSGDEDNNNEDGPSMGGEWTISMFVRWMPGGSVASLLAEYGAFREPITLAYAIQTARGLAYIHGCSILHRDLKGANLLLDTSGMRLRISDFGASARLSNGRDSNASDFRGQLLGTIAFMAPEVLRGEQYGRSCDVWSFACCIIEMLTGSQPWRDQKHTNHLALMYTIASAEEPPKLPEKISKDLRNLLSDCLNREPKQRPLSSQLEAYKVFQQLHSC